MEMPHLAAFIWFQYLNFPPWVTFLHSFTWSQDFPSGFLTTFCMHFTSVPMSRRPPSLSRTSCAHFVLISKLPPRCPSATSCIHLVLYLVPSWPPKVPPTCAFQQLPAFMPFQYLGFPPSSLHSFLHAPSFGFNI